jgi:murein L,D-transpeptidase YafK
LAAHKDDKWYDFWRNLKEGYDYFEISHLPPPIAVCEKRYLVNVAFTGNARPSPTGACPAYQRLPVPRAPAMQEASAKPKPKSQAALAKPLGSVLGLRFGPSRPPYSAFTLGPATPDR